MGEAKPPSVWAPEMMIARVSLAEHPRAVSSADASVPRLAGFSLIPSSPPISAAALRSLLFLGNKGCRTSSAERGGQQAQP
jgi:hypothetical protein